MKQKTLSQTTSLTARCAPGAIFKQSSDFWQNITRIKQRIKNRKPKFFILFIIDICNIIIFTMFKRSESYYVRIIRIIVVRTIKIVICFYLNTLIFSCKF